MHTPFVLLTLALAIAAVSFALQGPELPFFVASLVAFASLILLGSAARKGRETFVVIDGSNVMFWEANRPSLDAVLQVVEYARSSGLTPLVWFDANVGYKVSDKYLGPVPLARQMGLPSRQIFVAPKGTPADPLLLERAQKLGARIVTNDKFRDWAEAFPCINSPGMLRQGRIQGGQLSLDLTS